MKERAGATKAGVNITRLFVYGTLLEGEPNYRYLTRSRLVGAARTQQGYRMHDLGYYPGVVNTGTGQVLGELYEVDDETLANIDRLERHPDYYQRTAIMLEDGAVVETYLLPLNPTDRFRVVESGDWRTWRRTR